MLTYHITKRQTLFMKQMILALSILIFVGCTKPKEGQLDPNKQYFMKYQNGDQAVKMRVSNDTLRLDFYENLVVLVDPKDFANSWAMHLIEDFSNTYLKNLHFDALATKQGYAHDWIPVNLNDAADGQKTSKNVTVDGKQYVEVTVARKFEFYNKLASNQAALDQKNTLLNTTNHTVTYKAFYSDGGGYSISNDGTFKIVYSN
jgi:hypothetical protein